MVVKRILVAFGTRPECIKLAPVIRALRGRPHEFQTVLCSSGQHREMLDQALSAFALSVDHDLGVMRPDQALSELTSLLVSGFARVISQVRPDWMLVQGDTTTAFAAALSASYHRVPIAHVEAGLRSDDRSNPFPEEANRRLIAVLADLHFAPTAEAAAALRREGVGASSIHVTGNTIVDAVMALKAELEAPGGELRVSSSVRALAPSGRILFVTCHRRENFGDRLKAVLQAVRRIALAHPADHIVFPVHLNPNVKAEAAAMLGSLPNVHLLDPVSYPDSLYLLSKASLVLTDSGGLQEEAPSFGVPVLVLRSKTERPEVIAAGLAELVGTDEELIVARACDRLVRPAAPLRMANPYGDGQASARIADILASVR